MIEKALFELIIFDTVNFAFVAVILIVVSRTFPGAALSNLIEEGLISRRATEFGFD